MPLIRQGRIEADPYQAVADGEPLPADGAILIGLARWQEERGLIETRNGPIGLRLKPSDPVEQIAGDLGRLSLVALEFPKFNDGRAYSQARLLRQRHGYGGEIRATGRVLRDQLLFMRRAGFDAFEVGPEITPEVFAKSLGSFTLAYQPAADETRTTTALRHPELADSPRREERQRDGAGCAGKR